MSIPPSKDGGCVSVAAGPRSLATSPTSTTEVEKSRLMRPKLPSKKLKVLLEGSKKVNGKLMPSTIRKAEKLLMEH